MPPPFTLTHTYATGDHGPLLNNHMHAAVQRMSGAPPSAVPGLQAPDGTVTPRGPVIGSHWGGYIASIVAAGA